MTPFFKGHGDETPGKAVQLFFLFFRVWAELLRKMMLGFGKLRNLAADFN